MDTQNTNNQITPPGAPEKTPFYQTTWFILLTTFCLCLPVGLFLMWKYKKFHVGVRIALTTFFSLYSIAWIVAAVFLAVQAPTSKASSSAYSKYNMETTTEIPFESEKETTAETFEYKAEETTRTVLEETTTAAAMSEPTSSTGTVYDVSANDMIADYSTDSDKADLLYKGKTLRMTATIYNIENDRSDLAVINFSRTDKFSVYLIRCEFTDPAEIEKVKNLQKDDTVTVVGVSDGYFVDPILIDCKIQ